MRPRSFYILLTVLVLLFFVAFLVSLFGGRLVLAPQEVFRILSDGLRGNMSGDLAHAVVWNLRMPRVLLAALVGAGLATAGTAFQGIFRNPLVSPDVLGVSSGAAFGAVFGILLTNSGAIISLLALGCGLLSVFCTYFLSILRGHSTTLTLVLAGMIVSSVCSALISLIKYVADPYDKLPAITFWLMGSFSTASYNTLLTVGIPIFVGIFALYRLRWRLNVLSLGDDEAMALGISPIRIRKIVIALGTLVTAACVTATGIVGWIGLVVPHMARLLVGADHLRTIPVACLLGASFMILVDFVARTATAAEIPVGILTALIGAPFFAILFKRQGGGQL